MGKWCSIRDLNVSTEIDAEDGDTEGDTTMPDTVEDGVWAREILLALTVVVLFIVHQELAIPVALASVSLSFPSIGAACESSIVPLSSVPSATSSGYGIMGGGDYCQYY